MSKIEIPPFDPGHLMPKPRYDWWSWNPWYPRWARSCWGGETEALARYSIIRTGRMSLEPHYEHVLVKQELDKFTVIDRIPCQETDRWEAAFERKDP
jgi:hypothetical protein